MAGASPDPVTLRDAALCCPAPQAEGLCKLVGDVEELVQRANRTAHSLQVGGRKGVGGWMGVTWQASLLPCRGTRGSGS